jgi:hypothetical protein
MEINEDDIRKAMEGIDLPSVTEVQPGMWRIHIPGQPDLYTGKGGADLFMECMRKEAEKSINNIYGNK